MIKLMSFAALTIMFSGCSHFALSKYDPADDVMAPPFLIKERAAALAESSSVDITKGVGKKTNEPVDIQGYRDKIASSDAAYKERELDLIEERDNINLKLSELKNHQDAERKAMKEKAKKKAYDIYKETLRSLDSE